MKIVDIRVLPEEHQDLELLLKKVCEAERLDPRNHALRVLKRSIDARGKQPRYQLRVEVRKKNEKIESLSFAPLRDVHGALPVIIIGTGPAGLFAALTLARKGFKPILLERGKKVRERRRSLVQITRHHEVDPDSNYCFGEGGAGTYSDGKLYTRSVKRGSVQSILEDLVHFGAPEDILIDAHPHIGTDKLPAIIERIRTALEECGAEYHFDSRVTKFNVQGGKFKGVETANGQEYEADHCVLATGHSARDIFEVLDGMGLQLEAKPFALGVRIEHPQSLIDRLQYHCDERGPYLPPSSYALVSQVEKRGVFSFCMCPGGIIAPCATAPGEIVTNGWSPSGRNNQFANSGIVVEIREKDLLPFKKSGPLAALHFQKSVEQAAWREGGKTQTAPAQRMMDFVNGKVSINLPASSYTPGITSVDLKSVLPDFVFRSLQSGLKDFGKKMKGYLTNEAVLHAVESRTSSPIRIPRDPENLQHPQVVGLFPCGEGAGYAGGIVSAAMDGVKVAEVISANK